MKRTTIVVDNGGGSIKYGLAKKDVEQQECKVMPNCITKSKSEKRRPFVGDQLKECRDTSALFYVLPFQKGYLCAPDTQKVVWDHLFGKDALNINPADHNLLITEPIFNFVSAQEVTCELIFEEYGFHSASRTTACHLADIKFALANKDRMLCTLVVDSGYSFTHVVPFINGKKIDSAIRRVDVGGKVLTNYLKELISYRQLHVLDETYLMNLVKEDSCFVTTDLKEDFKVAKTKFPQNTIYREYVLPDYQTVKKGYLRPLEETGMRPVNEQIIKLNNERFTVPELLFRPSMVGIDQMGVSETIVSVIESFPENLRPIFYKNIILIGGNAKFPGYADRIQIDVRREASEYYDVEIFCPDDPSTYAWHGGNTFAFDPDFKKYLVTREMYNEYGINAFQGKCDI